jgi:SH3-like domain-containing protein
MWEKIIFFILIFFCTSAFSNENYYLMLKNSKVNVRMGPGLDYPVKFIYKKKYLPVKIIDKKENFRKVIDHKKNSGWIHISQLKKVNSIIVLSSRILFKKPTFYSKPIANIESGKLFVLEKCKKNWCKVSSQNYSGWINIDNVWGKD